MSELCIEVPRLHSASLGYLRLSPRRERVCARALRFCRSQRLFSSWFSLPSRQSRIRVVALPIVSARRPQTVGILGLLLLLVQDNKVFCSFYFWLLRGQLPSQGGREGLALLTGEHGGRGGVGVGRDGGPPPGSPLLGRRTAPRY